MPLNCTPTHGYMVHFVCILSQCEQKEKVLDQGNMQAFPACASPGPSDARVPDQDQESARKELRQEHRDQQLGSQLTLLPASCVASGRLLTLSESALLV